MENKTIPVKILIESSEEGVVRAIIEGRDGDVGRSVMAVLISEPRLIPAFHQAVHFAMEMLNDHIEGKIDITEHIKTVKVNSTKQ